MVVCKLHMPQWSYTMYAHKSFKFTQMCYPRAHSVLNGIFNATIFAICPILPILCLCMDHHVSPVWTVHICLQQVSSQSSTMPSGNRERRLQIVGHGPSHIFVAEEYPIYVPMVRSWYSIALSVVTLTYKQLYMTVARNSSNYSSYFCKRL